MKNLHGISGRDRFFHGKSGSNTPLMGPHLWIACRRHADERHCVHANTIVRGPTKSPEDKLFKHFKENFEFLDRTVLRKYKWLGNEASPTGSYQFSTEMASEGPEAVLLVVQSWAESSCIYGIFPREDYRELLALLYFVLGAKIRRILLRGIRFQDEAPRSI